WKDDFSGANRFHEVREVNDHDGCGGRTRFDAHSGLANSSKRSLGTDHEFTEIEFSISDEFIEVVTANAPHDFGISPVDLCAIRVDDFGDPALESAHSCRVVKFHVSKVAPF